MASYSRLPSCRQVPWSCPRPCLPLDVRQRHLGVFTVTYFLTVDKCLDHVSENMYVRLAELLEFSSSSSSSSSSTEFDDKERRASEGLGGVTVDVIQTPLLFFSFS
jgi:hypothetical protein